MSANLRKILKQLKKELLRIYGENIDSIILYGSRARGDARADSDIDLIFRPFLDGFTNYSGTGILSAN
jgi:predicted nucleotidyltransferase